MDSDILNIEDIVMGRAMPDPPAAEPPPKPVTSFKPAPIKPVMNGPPSTVTSYQHENLQCFQCFITFCSAKAKERHMKKSHREEYKQVLQQGNTLFTCYVCDRTFSSSEELTQHQPTHSKDDKPFKCAHCKESFKTFSELTVHRRQQCPERQFPCKDCSETFRSAAMLRTHRLAHHPRQEEPTEIQPEDDAKAPTCKKCGQSFETETEFLSHTEGPDGQCNGTATSKKRGHAAAGEKRESERRKKMEKKKTQKKPRAPQSQSVQQRKRAKQVEQSVAVLLKLQPKRKMMMKKLSYLVPWLLIVKYVTTRNFINASSFLIAVMSIEYTLDIQLTEMGFPNIVHPQEASVAETPPNSSPSDNSSPVNCTSQKSLPDQQIKPLKHKQPAKVKKGSKKSRVLAEETEEDSEDSDVSFMEEEIEDEDDFCEEDEEEEEGGGEAEGDFPCNVCNLQFSSMFKLQDHMNLHTGTKPYSCAECGKRFSQIRNYRDHLRAHARPKTKQPKCRICLRCFEKDSDLKFHLTMNHFEDQFYECDRCKRVFTSMEICQHHIEFTCMRKVKCEQCGRYFPKEKLLKRHLESKSCHSKFKCADCPKIFTKKNALLKHSFSHLGLLPYTCVRCRSHFRLARLYLQHHCKPQRITCVACLREFHNDRDFQQHKKDTGCWGNQDHKGDEIRCLECGQRFQTKEDLKKHAGAHQRVLKCAECGKGFRSALLLMSHMGGHAGQSPCLCQSCGLGFPHQHSYDIHLKTCGQKSSSTTPSSKKKISIPSRPRSHSTASAGSAADVSNSTASAITTTTAAESSTSKSQTVARPSSSSDSPSLQTIGHNKDPSNPMQEAQEDSNDPSQGCWKLSLDKPPPPGMNLLLFLPVGQAQNSSLLLPCAVPQVLSATEIQASPVANGIMGGTLGTALAQLDVSMDKDRHDSHARCSWMEMSQFIGELMTAGGTLDQPRKSPLDVMNVASWGVAAREVHKFKSVVLEPRHEICKTELNGEGCRDTDAQKKTRDLHHACTCPGCPSSSSSFQAFPSRTLDTRTQHLRYHALATHASGPPLLAAKLVRTINTEIHSSKNQN
ncbi:hypothetical protein WMY93_008590 [Mugilogobius chulae]|uniref:C2H2-type domain-containing protein n=1 Tax=Mugilogobius chulae TaxID=88201 RepID=A0AAW0PQL2_9GOBI